MNRRAFATLAKFISFTLVFVLALGITLPMAAKTVKADSIKVVNYTSDGEYHKRVTDEDGSNETVVYCIQPQRGYGSSGGTDRNKRVKYGWNASLDQDSGGAGYAHALAWALNFNGQGGRGKNEFTPQDAADSAECASLIAAMLYHGYPNSNKYTEKETQNAVFWAIINGKKTNGDYDRSNANWAGNAYFKGSNGLVEEAIANMPEWGTWNLYVYTHTPAANAQGAYETQQFLVSAEFSSTPGPVVKTYVKAAKRLEGENAPALQDEQFSFRMQNKNNPDEYYTRMNYDGSIWFPELEFSEAGVHEYEIFEVIPDQKDSHITYDERRHDIRIEITEDSGKLIATVNGQQVATSDDEKAGQYVLEDAFVNKYGEEPEPAERSLGTTVKGASSKTPLELKAGEDGTITTDVVDTIQYKNLTGGASYRVSGTLIEKETGETIKTSEESKTADASGNGEWEVIFSGVTLEAGKSYVVLEKAVNEADENDWAEHNNREDKAQMVVVKETEPGEVTIQISKQDLGGTELEGAEMTVTGADDYSTSWTSDGSAKELSLLPGEYKLKETVAPDGYKQITTTITFEVDEAGKVTLKEATVDNGGKVEVMDENHIVLKDAPEDEPDKPTDPDDDEPDKPTEPDDDEPDKPTEPDDDEPEEPDNSTPTVNIQKVLHYTVNVGGSKYWNDNNNEAQARPESITMTLYGDGEAIESKTVTGAGDTWVFDFGERDMYKAGEPINYTVVETDVEYYESSVTAAYDKVQDETGSTLRFAVTNDYTGPSPDQLGAGRRGDRLGAARNTGDESSMLLWLCVMLAASAGLIIVTKISHNKKK